MQQQAKGQQMAQQPVGSGNNNDNKDNGVSSGSGVDSDDSG
jgi:hypothetical protein